MAFQTATQSTEKQNFSNSILKCKGLMIQGLDQIQGYLVGWSYGNFTELCTDPKKLEEACRMVEAKYPDVHLNQHTVRKYAKTQPWKVPLPAGRQPIIPPEEHLI